MTSRFSAARLARRSTARIVGIPAPTNDFTIHRSVRIPMRDGVELLANHYVPDTAKVAGTILVRSPYGRAFPFSTIFGSAYAARGYHVILQSVRGTFGSGGDFMPMVNEVVDGADTVAWLREQPWFTGAFATIGLSYLGFTQWALLVDPPPELKASIICVGLHDFNGALWDTGSFSLNDFLGWSDMVAHQGNDNPLRRGLRQVWAQSGVGRAAQKLPLGMAGRNLIGAGAPWYEPWLEHEKAEDSYWDSWRVPAALDRVEIPVLLVGGWQDIFLQQTLEQYRHLRGRGVNPALTVGSWTHSDLVSKAVPTVIRESLAWLGEHLSGQPTTPRSPVRIEVNNHGWVGLPDWPPSMGEQVLYLQPAQRLLPTAAPDGSPSSSFTFDPANPTPSIGGRVLYPKPGYRDDSMLALRADTLAFTGEPLTADLVVVGNPVIELAHGCDNPHHDLFVRVSEIDAKGKSYNVTDHFHRATEPSSGSGPLRLEFDATAHRFRAGSRIRVLVAGGSFPRFARNLGTGEPVISGRSFKRATHTVHHGIGGQSRLILPSGPTPPLGQ